MLIALEGTDGSGKSTVAAALREILPGAREGHLGPPESPETAIDECLDMVGDYRPEDGQDVIIDRLYWGDPVYGPIYRPENDYDGYGDLGSPRWRYLDMVMAARGGINALVDVPPAVARERLKARGDDYIDPADLEEIHAGYHRIYAESTTAMMVDGTDDPQDIAADIATVASHLEAKAAKLRDWPSYIGVHNPQALVLMPPDRDKRLELIKLVGPEWRKIGIASSLMPADQVGRLVTALGGPRLLVLASRRPGPEYSHPTVGAIFDGSRIRYERLTDVADAVTSRAVA